MSFDDLTSLKKKGTYFRFESTITKKVSVLKAMVKSFTDNYTSDWAEEKVYGRMDPIATFNGTTRRISFGLELVAGSFSEAVSNLEKVQNIIRSLYPKYDGPGGAISMSQSPLFKVQYSNLIQDAEGKGSKSLLGYVQSFSFEPNFDDLLFYSDEGEVFPKIIDFTFEMSVVHEHIIEAEHGNFPYRVNSKTLQSTFVQTQNPTDVDNRDPNERPLAAEAFITRGGT